MLMHLGTLHRKKHVLATTCPDHSGDAQLVPKSREIYTEGFAEKIMGVSELHALSLPSDFAHGRLLEMKQCMAYLVLVFFFLFSFSTTQAQQRENKQVKFMAKVETRNSFVQTHYATFLGVRAGLEFKFPVRCGIGYYWMLTNLDSKFYKPSDFGQTDLSARPKMRYAIGYVDFSFYEEDDWTLSVPVQIGVGETFYRSKNSNRFANGLIVPMEAGVSVDYLFTKWIGFGVGLGYRVMLKGNKKVKENFNSPYYQIRLNIAFSEIFRGLKKKKSP